MYALSWLKEAISVDHQAAALITTPMVGGITLLLLGAWIARTWRPRKPPFPVLTNPSAKFFADEYDDARQLFREKAEAAGAAVHILPLEGECWGGMCGDPDAFQGEDRLTVDVAVLSSPSDSGGAGPLLLHMSGVHGVEGHAGSAIQAKWLDMVAKKETTVPKGVTVVLVHVMNPYGFKHGRRYNENNVDLNRNMLVGLDGTPVEDGCDFSWACESHPVKADYDKFSPVMNYNRRWHCPVDDALFFLKTAYLLCRYKCAAECVNLRICLRVASPNAILYSQLSGSTDGMRMPADTPLSNGPPCLGSTTTAMGFGMVALSSSRHTGSCLGSSNENVRDAEDNLLPSWNDPRCSTLNHRLCARCCCRPGAFHRRPHWTWSARRRHDACRFRRGHQYSVAAS